MTAGTWTELAGTIVTGLAVVVAVLLPRHERRLEREAQARRDAEADASLVLVDMARPGSQLLEAGKPTGRAIDVLLKVYTPAPIRHVVVRVEWIGGVPIEVRDPGWDISIVGPICTVTLPHLEPTHKGSVHFRAHGESVAVGRVVVRWIDRWGNECESAPGAASRVVKWSE